MPQLAAAAHGGLRLTSANAMEQGMTVGKKEQKNPAGWARRDFLI
jgi:hypothetical protein